MAKTKKTISKINTKKRAVRKAKPATLDIDYVKSTAHRVVLVDGAHGGLSPNGRQIHMTLFNQRSAIPRRDTHAVTKDGKLGPLIKRTQRSPFVREVEITLMFDLQCARQLRTWLAKAIPQLESAVGGADKVDSQ